MEKGDPIDHAWRDLTAPAYLQGTVTDIDVCG